MAGKFLRGKIFLLWYELWRTWFCKTCWVFWVKGYLISDRKQLQNELKNALDYDGPALINILVRRGENCYPMVPPGKSNAQMVGYVNCED